MLMEAEFSATRGLSDAFFLSTTPSIVNVPAQKFDVGDWSKRMPFDSRLIAAWLAELPQELFNGLKSSRDD